MHIKRDNKGVAAIEFAIISNVLIMLFVLVIDISYILQEYRFQQTYMHNISRVLSRQKFISANYKNSICKILENTLKENTNFRISIVSKNSRGTLSLHGASIMKGMVPFSPNADYANNEIMFPTTSSKIIYAVSVSPMKSITGLTAMIVKGRQIRTSTVVRARYSEDIMMSPTGGCVNDIFSMMIGPG